MKPLFTFLIAMSFFSLAQSQTTLSNFQENQTITWGSVSAQGPSFGFYGMEFTFTKTVRIESVSVFIVDRKSEDETKATINFTVWSIKDKPMKELFLSEALPIAGSEVDGWKTFKFKKPMKLKKGTYLFGVGQPEIQGFVAFGGGKALPGYTSRYWGKMAIEGFSNGKEWIDLTDIIEGMGASEADIKMMKESVVMMKITLK